MEFKHFCRTRIEAIEKILESEKVQYDKWGDVENKVDLSFNSLSEAYKQAAEALLNEEHDSVDYGEVSYMQDQANTSGKKFMPSANPRAMDTYKDLMNHTMEAKSTKLKNIDSKKLQKAKSKGNSIMQDSREETISDNEDSSMLMDDSNLDQSHRKAAQHQKRNLLKDVLKDQEYNHMVLDDDAQSPTRKIEDNHATLDTTIKRNTSEMHTFGENYLYDGDVENVLVLLSNNRIFKGKVDLSGQKFTDQTLLKLSKILLQPFPQIIELNLERNPNFDSIFGTQGISELAESVGESQCLKVLKLGGVAFGFEGQWYFAVTKVV